MSSIRPQYLKTSDEARNLTVQTRINTQNKVLKDLIAKVQGEPKDDFLTDVNFILGVPEDIKVKVSGEVGKAYVENEEGFVIEAGKDISIYSDSESGLLYGCITLQQLAAGGALNFTLAYDYPVVPVRGIKVYLPAPGDIDYFKQLIDMACYYKYNTVMIEVGGAMEYKSHPEINEGWVEYCDFMNEYSDKTKILQEKTFDWKKNSIHAENGGGTFLSQDTVRELVAYCKERYMNVIPEMPSLSHCDYLLTRHPELAERQNDPYPDTYCPSNPDSYKLLFDILREVIDVFDPVEMNIGHDEYYSIAVCEKCKGKSAPQIFVDDIVKIKEFLDGFGVRTIIWGEKLLNAFLGDYGNCGGAERELHSPVTGKYTETIPATYTAIDIFPRDVKILHWYWGIDRNYEEEYHKRGLEVTYGNFNGPGFPEWTRRISRGVKGGIMSNWSALKDDNLQRNGFLFNMVYSYRMFWDKDFENKSYDELRDAAFDELFRYRYGRMLADAKAGRKPDRAELFDITHTTDHYIEYKQFVDGTFIDMDIYKIGEYVISYKDGTQASIDIIYGGNITNRDVVWERSERKSSDSYSYDSLLVEVSSRTLPVRIKGATWCRFIARNPYPDKVITGVSVNKAKEGYEIYPYSIKFI